jgi:hypothetical protein
VILLMVTGIYSTAYEAQVPAMSRPAAATIAASMATYRTAVVDYFSLNPGIYQSVDMATLKSSGVLPSWSMLYAQPATSRWANYRDPSSGIIYIYASSAPDVNIASEIASLSKNSILTGVYHTGDTTLHSPVFGDTGVMLSSAVGTLIPNGSPLWLAMRH